MPHPKKDALLSLVLEKESQIHVTHMPPHDYHTLKSAAINQELIDETRRLKDMLRYDDFEDRFIAHCRVRSELIEGSCLCFTAFPEGVCNQLYWQIAEILFHPTELHQMLFIILPNLRVRLMHDAVPIDVSKRFGFHNLAMTFYEESLSLSEKGPPIIEQLSQRVICGQHLLQVSDIAPFDFTLHQAYYDGLNRSYPDMAKVLYQHNRDLSGLFAYILMFRDQGQPPFQRLFIFTQTLRLGGTKMTGREEASIEAESAFTEFMGYLESLPLALKEGILSLRGVGHSKTVFDVMRHLRRGECVEIAASLLKKIIDNPVNRPILDAHSVLSPDYILSMKARYGRKHPIMTITDRSTRKIPSHVLETSFTRLEIHTVFDYISLLLSFPSHCYVSLLQQVTITLSPLLPMSFALAISGGVLDEEQRDAFFDALLSCHQKFGLFQLQRFFGMCGYAISLSDLFARFSPQARLDALNMLDNNGNTLLYAAISDPVFMRTLLDTYPSDSERLFDIQHKNNQGSTLLHMVALRPLILSVILESFHKDADRCFVINTKNRYGSSVLHSAVFEPESVRILLSSLSPEIRLLAVKEKDSLGNTVLHHAISNSEVVALLLTLLPAVNYLSLLCETNHFGDSVLYNSASYQRSLQVILSFLSPSERVSALQSRYRFGNTLLHEFASSSDLLTVVLDAFPTDDEIYILLQDKNSFGYSILHSAASSPETLNIWLARIGRMPCLKELLLQRNNFGVTVLHEAARNPACISVILNALSEKDCFDVLTTCGGGVHSLLDRAMSYPESLRIILWRLSCQDRVRLLMGKYADGSTVLHQVISRPGLLKEILGAVALKDRGHLVMIKDDDGKTVLDKGAFYPASMMVIRDLLPRANPSLQRTHFPKQGRLDKLLVSRSGFARGEGALPGPCALFRSISESGGDFAPEDERFDRPRSAV